MKTVLLSLAAAAALVATTAPASAQPWRDDRGGGYHTQERYGRALDTGYVDSLEWKINNAARYGRISPNERRALISDLRQVQPLAWRVQRGNASQAQYRRLASTVNHIEAAISRDRRYAQGYRR